MKHSLSISSPRRQNPPQTPRQQKYFVPISSTAELYESVFSELQTRLRVEHDKGNHQSVTEDELKVVVGIFQFAETNRPPTGFGTPTSDETEYRAEFNTWCYYFNEPSKFPGVPPSALSTTPRFSNRALATKIHLLKILSSQKGFGPDYQPQMGWHPASGEPWLSFHCKARNAYPAISGPYNSHAKDVEKCVPEFKIMFQRFRKDGYVLIWPEFASNANLASPSAWERFAKFRAFLYDWSEKRGNLEHINDACKKWCQIPSADRKSEPLPADFRLTMPAKQRVTASIEQMEMSQETLVNESQEYDSWRAEPGSYDIEGEKLRGEDRMSENDAALDVGNHLRKAYDSSNDRKWNTSNPQNFDAPDQCRRSYRDRDDLIASTCFNQSSETPRDSQNAIDNQMYRERTQENYRRRSRSPYEDSRSFSGRRRDSHKDDCRRNIGRQDRGQDRDNQASAQGKMSSNRYPYQAQAREYRGNQGRADDVFRSRR